MMNDVWGGNAFTLKSLTNALNKAPFVPSRLGKLGIFQERGVPTTSIVIEEKNGILGLFSTKQRGAPAQTARDEKRKARSFNIPHIPVEDEIKAEDVQNVRAFGSENQLQGVEEVVADKLMTIRQSFEATHEWHRLGAIKGIVYDADGTTVIYNFFNEFNIGALADVDFVLGTSTTDIKAKCMTVIRGVEDALQGVPFDHVHCMCGPNFFDRLSSHPAVLQYYLYSTEAAARANDMRRGFMFAGIYFEEYRGNVGGQQFIANDEARFFPVGAPEVFMTYYAPADFLETANQVGIPMYAKQEATKFNRGRALHAQSNPLFVCTRPRALRRGTSSN